jgi:hypothetical protein
MIYTTTIDDEQTVRNAALFSSAMLASLDAPTAKRRALPILRIPSNSARAQAGMCQIVQVDSPYWIADQLAPTSFMLWDQIDTPNAPLLGTMWQHATSGCEQASRAIRAPRTSAQEQAARRVHRLVAIQGALGLSTQALAQVLQISRAQLYKWIDPSRIIELQQASVKRLTSLEALASKWASTSSMPLSAVAYEPVMGDRTIIDLLSSDSLDDAEIHNAFSSLAQRASGQGPSLTDRLKRAGFRARRPGPLPSDE